MLDRIEQTRAYRRLERMLPITARREREDRAIDPLRVVVWGLFLLLVIGMWVGIGWAIWAAVT
jgi:hypothetical protein